VGIREESLSNLEKEVKTRFRSIEALLVVRKGYLVLERYFGGVRQEEKHLVASVTKSFISALIGIAIEQGYLQGVHQRVLDLFPEYAPVSPDPLKQQITIKHLLTMTSGFQWRTGTRAHELYLDRLRRSKDWVAFILGLPVREKSFGSFQYNSGNSHLLSAILTRSTGKNARKFAAETLFTPLGIEPPTPNMQHTFSQADIFRNKTGGWPRDPQGNSIGGWGLALIARDLARFGFLYLNGGKWDTEQIVPKKWVEDSVMPHTPDYGYQWWLKDINNVSVFSAVGQGGNHIFCLPEKDLVVVVTSNPAGRWRDRWPLLEDFVIPAVEG
jgi:CubicO group peptidase (beta-lactamase class C family)